VWQVAAFTGFTVPKSYLDEAMMASFQTLANPSFTYPRIIQHYVQSPEILDSIVK
jgi:hypothetical protein